MFGSSQFGSLMLGGHSEEENPGETMPDVEVKGAGFSISIGSAVAQVLSCTPASRKLNVEETTTFDDLRVRKSGGLIDDGDYKLTIKFAPSEHAALVTAFESGEYQSCSTEWSDGTTETFQGLISEFSVQSFDPKTPAIKADITIAISYEEGDEYELSTGGGS